MRSGTVSSGESDVLYELMLGIAKLGGVSIVILGLGFALCFPFFSYLPLWWSASLVFGFFVYFGICQALRRKPTAVGYVTVGLLYSAVFGLAVATQVGVERVEEYSCNWKFAGGDMVEIDMAAVGGFGHVHVSSANLIQHLKNVKPSTVRVSVEITRDFGRIRARGRIRLVEGMAVIEPLFY